MHYDHIVVGSGSAGTILASRLSEDPGRSVLLLEAGPDFPDLDQLPADLATAATVSVVDHDWGYRAEAVPGRTMEYARGKVTGGCSAVNGAIALRGLPGDFGEWAGLGNDAWSWDEVLPYYRRIESDQGVEGPLHGKDGPNPFVRFKHDELVPLQKSFLDACLDHGWCTGCSSRAPAPSAWRRRSTGCCSRSTRAPSPCRPARSTRRRSCSAPVRQLDDDEALLSYIRQHSATLWHPVGTCRMGGSGDPEAVVDQRDA